MPDFLLRPGRPDDAEAVVALRAKVFPYLVRGVATTRRQIESPPPGEDWAPFAAEHNGALVGWVAACRDPRVADAGFGRFSLLHVDPGHRRLGIGTALFEAAADHLRAVGVRRAGITVTPEAVEIIRRRGFETARELRYSSLGLLPSPPSLLGCGDDRESLDGVTLRPLSGITDPDELYAADVAAASDEPSDEASTATPYPTWVYEIWEDPGLDKDLSVAAYADGRIVSFALLQRDGERVWSDMTATDPAYRGRGLARAVKLEALGLAAAAGARVAYTSNDEANRPMLAVNNRLGYRPVATQWSCIGDL